MDYNKFRRLVGVFFALFLLVLARPPFFYPALVLVGLGMAVRLWAAGYIHKNEEVTTSGPYGLVRHPLYLGSFCLGLGLSLFIGRFWVVPPLPRRLRGGLRQEDHARRRLPPPEIRRGLPRLPRPHAGLLPLAAAGLACARGRGAAFSWDNVAKNREHLNALAFMLLVLLMILAGYLRSVLFA
ncbi:MAG: methyltransferase family protein [Bacillota bacterium]